MFQANYIPEFRSLIAHMRKHEGYGIIDEPCLGKCGMKHNSKGLKRWRLVSIPKDKQEWYDDEKYKTPAPVEQQTKMF